MEMREKIVVVGFGWVGQANAIALVDMGYEVSYFDPASPKHHYEHIYPEHYDRIRQLSSVLEIDGENTCYSLRSAIG